MLSPSHVQTSPLDRRAPERQTELQQVQTSLLQPAWGGEILRMQSGSDASFSTTDRGGGAPILARSLSCLPATSKAI